MGEIPIIGKENQPFTFAVQTANVEEAFVPLFKVISEARAAIRVRHGG
jgi:hypothetical protein